MLLSLLAVVLYAGILVGSVFLFRVQFIIGIACLILLLIPLKVQRKAIDAADGRLDAVFAKYITPAILLVAIIFIVLYFTLWA